MCHPVMGFWYHSLAPHSLHIRGFAIVSWQQTPWSAEEFVPQSTLRQQKKTVMAVRGCSEPKCGETDCRQTLLITKGLTVSKSKCFARPSMRPLQVVVPNSCTGACHTSAGVHMSQAWCQACMTSFRSQPIYSWQKIALNGPLQPSVERWVQGFLSTIKASQGHNVPASTMQQGQEVCQDDPVMKAARGPATDSSVRVQQQAWGLHHAEGGGLQQGILDTREG